MATTFASWTCLPLHSTSAKQSLQAVRASGIFGQEGGPLADDPHVPHSVCRFQAEAALIGGPGVVIKEARLGRPQADVKPIYTAVKAEAARAWRRNGAPATAP